MPQDVEEADHAHFPGVVEETHPLAGQQIAADAEGLDGRIEALQLAEDLAACRSPEASPATMASFIDFNAAERDTSPTPARSRQKRARGR